LGSGYVGAYVALTLALTLTLTLTLSLFQASLYNSREVLFDEPQTGYSMLKVRVIPLTP